VVRVWSYGWQTCLVVALVALSLQGGEFSSPEVSALRFIPLAVGMVLLFLGPKPPRRPRNGWVAAWTALVGLFVLWAAISLGWAISAGETSSQLVLLGVVVGFVVLAVHRRWVDAATIRSDLALVYWTVAAITIAGLAAWLAGAAWATQPPEDRVRGLFLTPNTFGMIVALILPLGWALFRHRSTAVRVCFIATQAVLLAALLVTGSRTSAAAALAGLLAAALADRSVIRRAALLGFLVGGGLLLLGGAGLARQEFARDWLRVDTLLSGNMRFEAWSVLAGTWEEQPLIGYGFRSTEALVAALKANGTLRGFGPETAHNGFVQVLVELGAIGFALIVAVMLLAVAAAAWARWVPGLVGALVAGMVVQLAESSWYSFGAVFALVLWIMTGAAVAAARVAQLERDPPDETGSDIDLQERLAPYGPRPPRSSASL
jgi:exopolysaccharide production protein ExoQ